VLDDSSAGLNLRVDPVDHAGGIVDVDRFVPSSDCGVATCARELMLPSDGTSRIRRDIASILREAVHPVRHLPALQVPVELRAFYTRDIAGHAMKNFGRWRPIRSSERREFFSIRARPARQ
jgi:hypothetical protein